MKIHSRLLQRAVRGVQVFCGRPPKSTSVFISVDVEALLIRAPDDHVNRLIWGKTSGGEYGIRRLSDIFRQHKLKGNFLVDLAACTIHGRDKIQPVFDFLLGEGHEVHAHLHPEMLAEVWKLERTGTQARRFHDFDQFLTDTHLARVAQLYQTLAKRDPFLFRSGGYFFNRHTVVGAGKAGFRALSNYNARRHDALLGPDSPARAMDPFRWDNGVAEMPVDLSSPERLDRPQFLQRWWKVHQSKQSHTLNLVFHSWTLLQRNANEHFMDFSPEAEERVHQICAALSSSANVFGYQEYLTKNSPAVTVHAGDLPEVPLLDIQRARRCRDCFAIMSPDVLVNGHCRNCGSSRLVPYDTASHQRELLKQGSDGAHAPLAGV